MIIYNVTLKVEWSIVDTWLQWFKREHIPEVLDTKCFVKYQFVKLMDVDEVDGPTYAIQFYAHSLNEYNEYIANHSLRLRAKTQALWKEKLISIRTLMEIVN